MEWKNGSKKDPNDHILQRFALFNKYHLLVYQMINEHGEEAINQAPQNQRQDTWKNDTLIKKGIIMKEYFEKKFGQGTAFDLDYGKLLIVALLVYIAFFK